MKYWKWIFATPTTGAQFGQIIKPIKAYQAEGFRLRIYPPNWNQEIGGLETVGIQGSKTTGLS